MILIRPPARYSEGALTLRRALGDNARLSRRETPLRRYTHVINWGNSQPVATYTHQRLYNKPLAVARAVDKLRCFNTLKEGNVNVPAYSTNYADVSGDIVLARHLLSASGGAGITVLRRGDEAVEAPLYVQYIPKVKEYRVHVMNGEAIFVQQKRRRSNNEQSRDDRLIRNYDNGWVFTLTEEGTVPPHITEESVHAVQALGLDFGAVDIIEGRDDGKPYVLEVNCAPGLSSPTLIDAYTRGVLALTLPS